MSMNECLNGYCDCSSAHPGRHCGGEVAGVATYWRLADRRLFAPLAAARRAARQLPRRRRGVLPVAQVWTGRRWAYLARHELGGAGLAPDIEAAARAALQEHCRS